MDRDIGDDTVKPLLNSSTRESCLSMCRSAANIKFSTPFHVRKSAPASTAACLATPPMLRTASRPRRLWTVRGADAVELLDATARSGLRGLASSSNGGAVAASRADRTDTIARLVDFGTENDPGVFGEPASAPIPEGG